MDLQCCMPVFEGLLPGEHDKVILDLAFDIATWHAYAKLQKHTEHIQSQTKELGRQLHVFLKEVCSAYDTKPLPNEEAARVHRHAGKAQKGGPNPQPGKSNCGSNVKQSNMATYKRHALGDYADHIKRFGPTDCFTSQHFCRFSFRIDPGLKNSTLG